MDILGIHVDFPLVWISCLRFGKKGDKILWTRCARLIAEDPTEEKSHISSVEEWEIKSEQEGLQEEFYHVKQLYIPRFRGKIISALSAKDFLARPFDFKIANKKHLNEAICFQAEALSHFGPAEAIIVPQIHDYKNGLAKGLWFTVPRENLNEHLKELKKWNFDPDVITTVPNALCSFLNWKFPDLKDAFVINLGSKGITCILIEGGKLKRSHAIPCGIEDLYSSFYADRKRILMRNEIEGAAKQIDLLLLKPQHNPKLYQELLALRNELSKIHFSYSQNLSTKIVFTGRVDAFLHFQDFLMNSNETEAVLSVEEQRSAVSIGLCKEMASKNPLQLRREEFFPKKNWVRLGKYALLLLSTSLLLSLGFITYGFKASKDAKNQMFEKLPLRFKKGNFSPREKEKQMEKWFYETEKNNLEYPLISRAPKVSEVLSWLSFHPLLNQLKKEGDPINLREIRIKLENYPSIGRFNEPYLLRVEIEFQFKNVMNARRFHEALRNEGKFIDSSSEITWDVLEDGYRSAFTLKEKESYVS